MIRIVIENILLFLLPASLYVAYVLLTRRGTKPGQVISDAPLLWLFIAGALLVSGTLIYFASTTAGGRPDQRYTPPYIKDGQIEPGIIR
jgi:hypothetical protein